MSDKLGVALVGCGGIARCHAFALTRAEVRLVAAVDINEAAAINFTERFGFEEHTANLDEVLDRPDIDAVVITTSNKTHALLSVQAMRAGKHVMVQKPMAMSLAKQKRWWLRPTRTTSSSWCRSLNCSFRRWSGPRPSSTRG